MYRVSFQPTVATYTSNMRLLYSLTFFTFQHSTDAAEASTLQSAGGKRAEGDIDRIARDQHFESRVNTCALVQLVLLFVLFTWLETIC